MLSFRSEFNSYQADIEKQYLDITQNNVLKRASARDPLVWTSDATHFDEIKHRLDWLEAPDTMKQHLPDLKAFSEEVKSQRYQYAVLLGMGGSSLGPEVLFQCFGAAQDFPTLLMLDSTDPLKIAEVDKKIEGKKTLYIVASKSGTTIESASLEKYYRDKEKQSGRSCEHFVAITDPGTFLVDLATKLNYQRIFLNPPDVGGRFSVLTLFGLVPAAVLGVDLDRLLSGALSTYSKLFNGEDTGPLLLGVAMGDLWAKGRDKMTLQTPKEWSLLGDWVEQLVAESTGKEGKGILPVVQEAKRRAYDGDRFFVELKAQHSQVNSVSGDAPRFVIEYQDNYDLGAIFYTFEIATMIAGAVMNIDPFDQPNVQEAKSLAKEILKGVKPNQDLSPALSPFGSESSIRIKFSKACFQFGASQEDQWSGLWKSAKQGDYISILAFVPDVPSVNNHLNKLKASIEDSGLYPVTLGIGPRYLHSTGQLHKGGANNGLFVVITHDLNPDADLPIPGETFSFGQLEQAQARGDFEALDAKGRRACYIRLKTLDSSAWSDFFRTLPFQLA